MPRGIKQFIFAFLGILIIGAIGFGVYSLFFKNPGTCFDGVMNNGETEIDCGGLCISCDERNIQPLTASEPMVLWVDGRTLSVLFEIKNPNEKFGSDNFTYKINLYDDHDALIKSIQKNFFIYGDETETLTEVGIDTGGEIVGYARVKIGDTSWIPVDNWKKPALKITSLETAKENKSYKVSGRIENPNSFDITRLVVNAVLYSKEGREIAVTKSELSSAKAFRTKGFIIYVKIDPSMEKYLDLSATKFFIYAAK
ncbi:MAG: hypothetical protein PHP03_03155 [Candidatus Pacebacteria bacterium]|nr:hypothetical protein [Candidatus Paceibacterota bacterium]